VLSINKELPGLEAAKKAANNLAFGDITEIKSLKNPPQKVKDVCICVNWIIMPLEQKAKFGDWIYNQTVMQDGITVKKKLFNAKDDILVNPDQYK